MEIPLKVRVMALVAGVNASDFAGGWANGVVRWKLRSLQDEIHENPLPLGSVARAASAAAVAFMRELNND